MILKKVLTIDTGAATRQMAEETLKEIEGRFDFITSWQMAGPYRQTGKTYADLFDIVFPPETAGGDGVTWHMMPVGTDPKRPWVMDLFKAFGGEECVAYARTSIHCDQEQKARLEVGADDGVKIWLNGKVVHANNVVELRLEFPPLKSHPAQSRLGLLRPRRETRRHPPRRTPVRRREKPDAFRRAVAEGTPSEPHPYR